MQVVKDRKYDFITLLSVIGSALMSVFSLLKSAVKYLLKILEYFKKRKRRDSVTEISKSDFGKDSYNLIGDDNEERLI